MDIIGVSNVCLTLGKTEILKHINVSFEEGKIHGLIGRNGSGIIIETPGFIPYYSGYKNLKLLAGLNNKIGKDEIKSSMKQVGLDPELKRHVRKYSLGMRQRLGLAQAIMENPKILILDEPFNGLDKDGVKEMREYLLSYKEQGKTILICSHSAEDISVLCDTVHEMDKGYITQIEM